jgi:hypothetical protein
MLGVGPLVVIPTLKAKAGRGTGKRKKRRKGLLSRRKAAAA